ncbi:prepilin-type N-terminal cleavage/methylation domain-containing protein [Oleiharenicola lentus]|jgi:prepilin-type N-terminal cleavage/methylation domain-containing protein|uniref:Prepilin-type N-terminal cleavage/methylation domain-containing protein n=1 Tax=Oleiharenicola lentus TaxID=2508720 RepID=A0A4V1M6V5_9BACT|nr:prepilin-type N-terminal cleavage/methylation domain-containing protein [Oleiharenicola lentus]RXK56719.1 prepilin-type N-terminal cleavage/methylation domain-containing protein [Oleiharenicola lentus]
MKTSPTNSRRLHQRGFTLVEVLISMTVISIVMTMCLSTFLFGLRTMYKDSQRLETNATLRSLMAQISKETLDASFFYLFPYYTDIDTNVSLVAGEAGGPSSMQLEDAADNDYDKWIAHGDCLVLVTATSQYRTSDIRQIRIYYRMTGSQEKRNVPQEMRYYETKDWGEGSSSTSNGHPLTGLAAELNAINLAGNASPTGYKVLADQTIGRAVTVASSPFVVGDRYPSFSSESPDSTATNGFIAINMEVVNGTTRNNMLSSSSFNYTVSPRR